MALARTGTETPSTVAAGRWANDRASALWSSCDLAQLGEAGQFFLAYVEQDFAAAAVHDGDAAGQPLHQPLAHGADERDAHAAGKDRRVRGGRAFGERDADDMAFRQLRQVGRGQVFGEEDRLGRQVGQERAAEFRAQMR